MKKVILAAGIGTRLEPITVSKSKVMVPIANKPFVKWLIDELEKEMPQIKVKEYIQKVRQEFTELTFMPLDEVWERELGNLFDDE